LLALLKEGGQLGGLLFLLFELFFQFRDADGKRLSFAASLLQLALESSLAGLLLEFMGLRLFRQPFGFLHQGAAIIGAVDGAAQGMGQGADRRNLRGGQVGKDEQARSALAVGQRSDQEGRRLVKPQAAGEIDGFGGGCVDLLQGASFYGRLERL
jgi:hypothetical protein